MYFKRKYAKQLVSFCLVAALMMTVPAYAYDAPSGEAGLSNVAHVYTVKPGTDEWVSMSVEQRLASCRVTKAEVEAMTTEALIETIVNYPYIINLFAYDSVDTGIEMVSNHFPGIKELVARSDAVNALREFIDDGVCVYGSDKVTIDAYVCEILYNYLSFSSMPSDFIPPLTGEIETPNGTDVPVYKNLYWDMYYEIYGTPESESLVYQLNSLYPSIYPGVSQIAPPSFKYNCSSYALYQQSSSNIYWIYRYLPYFTDESYVSSTQEAGAVITYSSVSGFSNLKHFGIMVMHGSQLLVRSKWGCYGLFQHGITNCPYYVDNPIVQYWSRG